ncbi:hypothetical protein K439DRAFT_1625092 [Ramaria rubella]|nr:hypothetical protein K439DRAFT_1625092 [Ramaria rubella]
MPILNTKVPLQSPWGRLTLIPPSPATPSPIHPPIHPPLSITTVTTPLARPRLHNLPCSAEIAIGTAPAHFRKGFATEALYPTLTHAFEHPRAEAAPCRVCDGAGEYADEGVVGEDGRGRGVCVEGGVEGGGQRGRGGRWLDAVGYSVLEGEWPALRARIGEKLTALLGLVVVS